MKWNFRTYHHWEPLINMLSKSNINLNNRTSRNLGLQIHNNQSMIKATLTHREINLKTTIPRHGKKKVTGRQRRTLGSGVTSKKSMNHTLIQKTIKGDIELMHIPLILLQPQQSNQKNQRILRKGSVFSIHRCG
jgi:hypothetical protein